MDIYLFRKTILSRLVLVRIQDYILTPGRYVGIEEKAEDDEPFDEKMKRLTSELGQMFTKSHELEDQIKKNLEGMNMIAWAKMIGITPAALTLIGMY